MTTSIGLTGHGRGTPRCRVCRGYVGWLPDGTPFHLRYHPGHVAVGPHRDTGEIVQGRV